MDELKLQLDLIALAASVTDSVRHQLARHEQGVLQLMLVDPASAKCIS